MISTAFSERRPMVYIYKVQFNSRLQRRRQNLDQNFPFLLATIITFKQAILNSLDDLTH